MRIARLSWGNVEKDCRTLSKKILTDGFRPDICVAVSRGGFPPARILCDLLGITNLTSIRIEHYSDFDETLAKPRLVFPLNVNVRDMRVLIVDDVADRGDSLMLAKKHVQVNGATEIKVAALHYKPWSKLIPDYYAREYKSWIMYPWEVNETVRKIISNLQQRERNMSQIRKALFQIGITEPEIRMATKELVY